ncbi:MAG TPA: glycosyl hydrolase, partial [Chitinophagaceae bacterium]|nr:glycosyl hydrolase [Chitinophagaceae bacterium]
FECDKFDTTAFNDHLNEFTGKLLTKIGSRNKQSKGGLTMLHMDSWEMGSQNWTNEFRNEFMKRRGYDPLPFYPVYAGKIVESLEISERFLWDLRQTSQELIVEYHAQHLKKYSHQNGFGLSIEPYDMNPSADMELGAVADVPMCEFWSPGGFNSSFSCIQAASIAHVNGQPVVAAEAFTAVDGWMQHPGSMKNQGDWAFATGINKFVYHTFQHQPLDEKLKPGMTMGPYGVQWNRNQTWWSMADAYHKYISRCQYLLRQGKSVADILYLTPEGSPHVFRAPASALSGGSFMPDRKGYNFDGCSPAQLYNAFVKDNKLMFPGGASYHLLVLPVFETMTPALLEKIKSLINEGATVIGSPPEKSPGLSGYPDCDIKIKSLVKEIWGSTGIPDKQTTHNYGKGKIIWGGELNSKIDNLYPAYDITAKLLTGIGVQMDFEADSSVRYTHRESSDWDLYFVSNRTDRPLKTDAIFRTAKGSPSLWDPLAGKTKNLPESFKKGNRISVPLQFEPYQSFFIVFTKDNNPLPAQTKNFPVNTIVTAIEGPWAVSFDTVWGGPGTASFNNLEDWTQRGEKGIKYYSGIATYKKTFDLSLHVSNGKNETFFLDLGEVKNMAGVKLNGKAIGIVWTAPWKLDISDALKEGKNVLEIEVANLWPNRLIGDEQMPDDGIKDGQWPDWLLNNKPRTSGRYTFSTHRHYNKDSPLLKSGLIGPVTIQQSH